MTTFQLLFIHQFTAVCFLAPLKLIYHLVKFSRHFLFHLCLIWSLDRPLSWSDSTLFLMFLPFLSLRRLLICANSFSSAHPLNVGARQDSGLGLFLLSFYVVHLPVHLIPSIWSIIFTGYIHLGIFLSFSSPTLFLPCALWHHQKPRTKVKPWASILIPPLSSIPWI